MHKKKHIGKVFDSSTEKWDALKVGQQFSILDTPVCTIVHVDTLSPTVLSLRVSQEGYEERTIIMGLSRAQHATTTFQLADIELI